MAVVPSAPSGARWVSGAWAHASAPASTPAWVTGAGGFAGTLVYVGPSSATDQRLVIRAAVPTPDRTRLVVADLPVDRGLVGRLKIRTAIDLIGVASSDCGVPGDLAALPARGLSELFTETTTFMDCTNWRDGSTGAVGLNLHAPVLALSDRLASVRSTELAERVGDSWWSVFVQLLILLTVLALIVQGAALVMGAVLAKSITSAVHELFTGTERIQQGDFSYRIPIESRDQLGDLASSFNRMSGSVEHLLVVQREKQRLDDELRIARDIQRSLLPPAPPSIAGLTIADLCEPAREVGGDYYDFFAVGPRQIGVLIADVSGKGTSAALYMAELKGLMLALSHEEPSPRQLLIDVNQRLADQLDNRSFITMTYAVIDLARGTLTVARAGHTPLILVSAGRTSFVMPDGMVVGLRLPGAEQRFEQLLTEETRSIHPNDIIVLYTDGVTEAMDAEGELFGHGALARVVVQHHERQPKEIREEILREIRRFSGDADPHDDMTMVILKVDPAPEGR
jgi:serine phosphatase RsbU (regulator of sigma subunit)